MFGSFYPKTEAKDDQPNVCTYCAGHKIVSYCDCTLQAKKRPCGNYKEETCPMCKGTGEGNNG